MVQKIFDNINRYAAYTASGILILLVALVVYDATMRYLFQSGSVALQELEWHFFDVVILLGIAYTLQRDLHVRVDIFYEHFSLKTKALVNLISIILFVMPFSVLILYIGYDFVMLSFTQMEASSDPGGLPYRFIVKALMPLSFMLLLFQSLSQIVTHVRELCS